ncbi:AI-2E family transporter [Pleionea mediterranea]|uniref:Putative PurR-regulated permease PerM n=1 Tax=Pleionea mediterranea TaxID=523701 RepID=A0A316FSK2_9GAMM|nr:AI-2E family transporter [Pleionea mediterranea]PWK51748.1 putative PurR-regulated permease PerM [Pleionea mediterranea]
MSDNFSSKKSASSEKSDSSKKTGSSEESESAKESGSIKSTDLTNQSESPKVIAVPGWMLPGIVVVGSVFILASAKAFLLPLVASCLLALTLSPAVYQLGRLGIPRFINSLLMVLISAGLIVLAVWVIAPAIVKWVERAPEQIVSVVDSDRELKDTIHSLKETSEKVTKAVEDIVQSPPKNTTVVQGDNWSETALSLLQQGLGATLVIMTLTFFLLSNGNLLILNLVRQSAKKPHRRRLIKLFRKLRFEVGRYLGAVFLINLTVGLVTSAIMWFFDVPMPWVWAVLVTLMRFIPYVGVSMVAILIFLVSITHFGHLIPAVLPPLSFLVLSSITGLFIDPMVHGVRLKVNPVIVFISVIFWGWLWGIAGAILAVPMLTIILVVSDCMNWKRFYSVVHAK